jgi:hypothetical protein
MTGGALPHLWLRLRRWWTLRTWQRELQHLAMLEASLVAAIDENSEDLSHVRMAARLLRSKHAAATAPSGLGSNQPQAQPAAPALADAEPTHWGKP